MSLATFARVWATSPASGNTFLVHLALADLARENLVQAPQADIAMLARCSVPTVSRALQELVDAGVIEILDERTKTPIYRLIYQGDGFSDQLRAQLMGNLQNDGILQDDMISLAESDQVGGMTMGQPIENTGAEPAPRGMVPESEPFRAQPFEASIGLDMPSNIGQPMPITTGDVAEVELREPTQLPIPNTAGLQALDELRDEISREVRDQTGISRVIVEPTAPAPTFRAMAATILKAPEEANAAQLSAVLAALGVQPNPEAPLYWYRDEHVKDFQGLLRLANMTPGELLDAIHSASVKTPSIRRIADTHDALARAGIIPF
jgi:hypothetical protein